MKSDKADIFSIIRLKYKKGELIVKGGDYGISIYKVLKGRVQIFSELEDSVISLATLGPGEIIGEMIFLNRDSERRSASARALEDSELEVWHPEMLAKEYEQMAPILKYLADQAMNRLTRMNKLIIQLTAKKRQQQEKLKQRDPWAAQRRYYRKEVNLEFVLRSVGSDRKSRLNGEIKDISLGGAGLEVRPKNVSKFPFKKGDELIVNTFLPNDKALDFKAKIVSIRKGRTLGSFFLGTSFKDLTDIALKNLGFFLMPA
jgi:CRP-like cAMP-binding protein